MVFVSFGILMFTPDNFTVDGWNGWFILITLVMCFVARACNTFVLSFFLNLGRKQKISLKCQVIMWYCGMRGIVTLLLVLNVHSPHQSMMMNTTFIIIFFTNFVIGLTMRPLVKAFNVGAEEEAANLQDPGQQLPPEYITRAQLNSRSRFARWWFLFDNKVLKKAFGGRVRILIEDEKDIKENTDSAAIVDVEKPEDDGQTELSSLKPKKTTRAIDVSGSGKAEDTAAGTLSSLEIGEVEFEPPSESDSDYDSDDDLAMKHAAVETASESLRDFRIAIPTRRRHHRHHHHHYNVRAGPSGVPSNYGTSTTSRIPTITRKMADEDFEYDEDDSLKTKSAVYSAQTSKPGSLLP